MSDVEEYHSEDSPSWNQPIYSNDESVSGTSGSDKENQIPSSQVSTATPKKTVPPRRTPIKKRREFLIWPKQQPQLTAARERLRSLISLLISQPMEEDVGLKPISERTVII